MIRTLDFVFIVMAGLVCLGLYGIAERTRVAEADLRASERAIAREHNTLTVLGAEWARVTQPARIQALAERHLDLADMPAVQLSSLAALPRKDALPLRQDNFRLAGQTLSVPDAAPDVTLATFQAGQTRQTRQTRQTGQPRQTGQTGQTGT